MKKHTVRWAIKEAKRVEAYLKETAELEAIEKRIVGRSAREKIDQFRRVYGKTDSALTKALYDRLQTRAPLPSFIKSARVTKTMIHDSVFVEFEPDYAALETRALAAALGEQHEPK